MQDSYQHEEANVRPNHGSGKNVPENDGKLPSLASNRHTILALSACAKNFFRRTAKANDAEKTDRRQNQKAEVLARLGGPKVMDLEKAKRIIAAVETRAKEQGKHAVIAVCNAEGNPIAVHVMDGAFLVSYEVAVKKAYTSVAVKMSTMELSALCQPGGTFYGLQALDKVITFGGGIPLYNDGVIVGGLGVSGGTGEEDHDLALYGAAVFQTL